MSTVNNGKSINVFKYKQELTSEIFHLTFDDVFSPGIYRGMECIKDNNSIVINPGSIVIKDYGNIGTTKIVYKQNINYDLSSILGNDGTYYLIIRWEYKQLEEWYPDLNVVENIESTDIVLCTITIENNNFLLSNDNRNEISSLTQVNSLLNSKVNKNGDENINGVKTFKEHIVIDTDNNFSEKNAITKSYVDNKTDELNTAIQNIESRLLNQKVYINGKLKIKSLNEKNVIIHDGIIINHDSEYTIFTDEITIDIELEAGKNYLLYYDEENSNINCTLVYDGGYVGYEYIIGGFHVYCGSSTDNYKYYFVKNSNEIQYMNNYISDFSYNFFKSYYGEFNVTEEEGEEGVYYVTIEDNELKENDWIILVSGDNYDINNIVQVTGVEDNKVTISGLTSGTFDNIIKINHFLNGYGTDILPLSLWDINNKPKNKYPYNMVYIPLINKWVDIYLCDKNYDEEYNNNYLTPNECFSDLLSSGKTLPSFKDFQIFALGTSDGNTSDNKTGGNIGSNGRKVSIYGVEDSTGIIGQLCSDTQFEIDNVEYNNYSNSEINYNGITKTIIYYGVCGYNDINNSGIRSLDLIKSTEEVQEFGYRGVSE